MRINCYIEIEIIHYRRNDRWYLWKVIDLIDASYEKIKVL